MKKAVFVVLLAFFVLCSRAQDSQTAFNFLRLPASAHVAALGGDNITVPDDDGSLVFHNPALIYNVSDSEMGLNMMTYMQGSVSASAQFVRTVGPRGSWALQGRFVNYGEMKETTAENVQTGTFHAKDIAIGGTFAYGLSDRISGGVTAKMVTSYIGQYNSQAVAVDLGLNYYDAERGWSISAVARNLGGQLSAYDDDFEKMPLDLQVGLTKRLVGSPLRFSATLVRLNDWQYGIGKHLVMGADLLLSNQLYVSAGYNAMRAAQMKITAGDEESSHGAAFSLGGGLQLERLRLHVAYAKLHVSSPSLIFNFSYIL